MSPKYLRIGFVLLALALQFFLFFAIPRPSHMRTSAKAVRDVAGRVVQTNKNHDKGLKVALSTGRLFPLLEVAYGADAINHLAKWRDDMKKDAPAAYKMYKKEYPVLEELAVFGLIKSGMFSVEDFLSGSKPDVFLLDISNLDAAKEQGILTCLEKNGVQVVFVDFREDPHKHSVASLRAVGEALGKRARFEAYIKLYEQKLAYIVSNLPEPAQKKSFFIERAAGLNVGGDENQIYTFGNMNIAQYIEELGLATNHGAKLLHNKTTGHVYVEAIMADLPDAYFMMSTGWKRKGQKVNGIPFGPFSAKEKIQKAFNALSERWWLKSSKLYAEKNIHSLDMVFYNSIDNIAAVEYIAKSLYPELYAALDPARTLREIQEIIGVDHRENIVRVLKNSTRFWGMNDE